MHERDHRTLPEALRDLDDLALDVRWTASRVPGLVWERLDPEAWERTENPYLILLNAHQDRFDELARDPQALRDLDHWLAQRHEYMSAPGWFGETHQEQGLDAVAYFSMEFGLTEALRIHSGGLGMLAGDHLKSASDLGVPLIGIGMLYQQGYFRQVVAEDGEQVEAMPYNDPSTMPVTPVRRQDGRWLRMHLELPGRTLLVRVWEVRCGRTRLYLLDTNDPLNGPWDRGITASLYPADPHVRLLQEIVLGVAGWRLLEGVGIHPQVCHLNEGHAAFAVVARAADFARRHGVPFHVALRATRAGNVFTTHTPVEAGFDRFAPSLLSTYARPVLESLGAPYAEVAALGRRDPTDESEPFHMAYLAIRGAGYVNGVSRIHGAVSRRLFAPLFPNRGTAEVPVGHVTNGVHLPTWDGPGAADLWERDRANPSWQEELGGAAEVLEAVSDEALWDYRARARHALVHYVRRRLVRQRSEHAASKEDVERARHVLDPNVLTIGFARRFATYKRPGLLFTDPERLVRILTNAARPVQLIVAGKAHPHDAAGKQLVWEVARFAARRDVEDRVVFLEDYDMVLARHLVAGVDVWINTPRRPEEACGTSGMKVLFNGGLNLSSLDGWWDEAYTPEVGWALGDRREAADGHLDAEHADALYALLEQQVAPEFYAHRDGSVPREWVSRVRRSMETLTPRFSAERMLRQYVEEAYLPAAKGYLKRSRDGARAAAALEEWRKRIAEEWPTVRVLLAQAEAKNGGIAWEVHAYLGELTPHDVHVEVYAEPEGDGPPVRVPLRHVADLTGIVNGHRYEGALETTRPPDHFTPRLVPHHPNAILPLEAAEVLWARSEVVTPERTG